jgi:hypothetical protein
VVDYRPQQVLVATDVAGRGLHISGLEQVINYDFPGNMQQYIHRVGRTGRNNCPGNAFTFFTRNYAPVAPAIVQVRLLAPPVEWNELGFDALGGDALVSPVACCQQPQRVCCAYAWGSGCGSCCVMATPCRIADGQGRKFDRGLHSVGVGFGR